MTPIRTAPRRRCRCCARPASTTCATSRAASRPGSRRACRWKRNRRRVARVLMYLTAACPYCQAAERLLARKGINDVERVRVDLDPARRDEMVAKSGRRTVPQIWVGAQHVGGSDELHALERAGELDPLLAKAL